MIAAPARYRPIADLVAFNPDGEVVLVVETKAIKEAKSREHLDQLRASCRAFAEPSGKFPYAMLVDLSHVRLYDWTGDVLSNEIAILSSQEVFTTYEPDFARKTILGYYLTALTDAWLQDIAGRWKMQNPPGLAQLESTGLAAAIKEGDTAVEYAIEE